MYTLLASPGECFIVRIVINIGTFCVNFAGPLNFDLESASLRIYINGNTFYEI